MRRVAIQAVMMGLALAAMLRGQGTQKADAEKSAAIALERDGKNAEAEAAWRGYLKTHPSSPEPYAHLGVLEAGLGHYKEAIAFYRKALTLGPPLPSLRLNLGLAQFKAGDLKAAIQTFTPLLKLQPKNQQLVTLIGMAHYGLAEYAAAVPYLRQAAASDAQSVPLRLALANSCLWAKQNQCVLDVYQEILALNPESAEADMLAGEALDDMKDNERSTKMFRAAVKANPKEPNAHFGLGYLLWSQKLFAEAASEFQAELANDPDHVQAKLYLADTDIQMNQMDAALPLLENVVRQNPSLPLVHLDLGIVYSETGQKEEALKELTAAEKIMPDEVNVHWRLARLYRALGKKDEARAEFEKADKLNKAEDEDLFKKIANGQQRPAPVPEPATAAPNP